MVSLVDYGSQSFITVPLSKLVDERKEAELCDICKETTNKIWEKPLSSVNRTVFNTLSNNDRIIFSSIRRFYLIEMKSF